MRPFTGGELTRLQRTQQGSMQDACVILRYNDTEVDAFNAPVVAWTQDPTRTPCGFDATSADEVQGESEIEVTDAKMRLPIITTITRRDRVKLSHRFGTALPQPLTFSVIGAPERGPSGLVLNLRLINDGSEGA